MCVHVVMAWEVECSARETQAPLIRGHVGHACVVCHCIQHLRACVYERDRSSPAPSLSYMFLFSRHTCNTFSSYFLHVVMLNFIQREDGLKILNTDRIDQKYKYYSNGGSQSCRYKRRSLMPFTKPFSTQPTCTQRAFD